MENKLFSKKSAFTEVAPHKETTKIEPEINFYKKISEIAYKIRLAEYHYRNNNELIEELAQLKQSATINEEQQKAAIEEGINKANEEIAKQNANFQSEEESIKAKKAEEERILKLAHAAISNLALKEYRQNPLYTNYRSLCAEYGEDWNNNGPKRLKIENEMRRLEEENQEENHHVNMIIMEMMADHGIAVTSENKKSIELFKQLIEINPELLIEFNEKSNRNNNNNKKLKK